MTRSATAGLELRHLRALCALTEEGTFTDAAIRLGVTQSAVSRSISALETLVGTALVERTTRSVALTPAGVRSYRAAVLALAAVQDVVGSAQDRVRPLRLGYSWSALGVHTTAVLKAWRTEHPDIPLEVHRIDEQVAGLGRGAVDVAIVRGPCTEPGLATRPVFTESRVAALATADPLAGRSELVLADLSERTMLLTANGTTTLELWPEAVRPRSVLRVDNLDEWLTEIAGGLAIGVTTEATRQLHSHPGVVYLPITDAPRVDVHLAWPQHHGNPAAPAFVELVARVITR